MEESRKDGNVMNGTPRRPSHNSQRPLHRRNDSNSSGDVLGADSFYTPISSPQLPGSPRRYPPFTTNLIYSPVSPKALQPHLGPLEARQILHPNQGKTNGTLLSPHARPGKIAVSPIPIPADNNSTLLTKNDEMNPNTSPSNNHTSHGSRDLDAGAATPPVNGYSNPSTNSRRVAGIPAGGSFPSDSGNGDATDRPHVGSPHAGTQMMSGQQSSQSHALAQGPNKQSGQQRRICAKCGQEIVGHFVRALGAGYHLECFVCADCGDQCAAKFFPLDNKPLCEQCYFRRQNLLCYRCGGSLRGNYITALDRKYHVEHFTCSLCPVIFGPDDSYFEHESDVFCRYHYATLHAARCEGCHAAILKQFVETYRGGREQQWHPECYMIFKFWNVKIIRDHVGTLTLSPSTNQDPPEEEKQRLLFEDAELNNLILRIWTTLCAYEEACAALISSLVQLAVAGNFKDAHSSAEKLIKLITTLFKALDAIPFEDPLGKEPKTLCRKLVAYMSLLAKTRLLPPSQRVQRLAKDLLALASGIAHYLKVLIRYGLAGALSDDPKNIPTSGRTLDAFLATMSSVNQDSVPKKTNSNSSGISDHLKDISPFSTDRCASCSKPVEDKCFRITSASKIWHYKCFNCDRCKRPLSSDIQNASYSNSEQKLYCLSCSRQSQPSDVVAVSKLEQFIQLLYVALARLDFVLTQRPSKAVSNSTPVLSGSAKSAGSISSSPTLVTEKRAVSSVDDMSTSLKHHQGDEPNIGTESLERTSTLLLSKASLTLDDIRRIVATEQARPRNKRAVSVASAAAAAAASSVVNGSSVSDTIAEQQESSDSLTAEAVYFGNLDSDSISIVQQISAVMLEKLCAVSLDELPASSKQKGPTLWEKMGKAFTGGADRRGRPVFGAPLDIVVERYGVDSHMGALATYTLRIPSFVDDCMMAMRQKDMSAEGVFRKNGNIRRLRETAEKVDKNPDESGLLADENVLQLAALLKKFLRELPDPLLTSRLTKVWLKSAKMDHLMKVRVAQLAVCSLPKANRDLLEVLVHFLNWTATFATSGEDDLQDGTGGSGSKMDVQNISSVLAPTLVFPPESDDQGDQVDHPPQMYIQAADPISLLIHQSALVAQVPLDVIQIMKRIRKLNKKMSNNEIAEYIQKLHRSDAR